MHVVLTVCNNKEALLSLISSKDSRCMPVICICFKGAIDEDLVLRYCIRPSEARWCSYDALDHAFYNLVRSRKTNPLCRLARLDDGRSRSSCEHRSRRSHVVTGRSSCIRLCACLRTREIGQIGSIRYRPIGSHYLL